MGTTRFVIQRANHTNTFNVNCSSVEFLFGKEADGELGHTLTNIGGRPGLSTISAEEFVRDLPNALALVHPMQVDEYLDNHDDVDIDCDHIKIDIVVGYPYDRYMITLPRTYMYNLETYYKDYGYIIKMLGIEDQKPLTKSEFHHKMNAAAKKLQPDA